LRNWLSNSEIAAAGVEPLRLILLSVAINAVYHLVYQRILAMGANRVVLLINVIVFGLTAPVLVLIAPVYGAAAGGMAWVMSSVLQLLMGMYWLRIKNG
jgi:O-antigen/teichoic acid export membrane protein